MHRAPVRGDGLHASDPRTDQELVEAANRGDTAAFEALYLRYRDWTVRLAYRFAGNADDALDVLQDTFAYLLKKFPGFELTARMTTFLYPAVKHLALARRRRRHDPIPDDEHPEAMAVPPAQPDATSRAELAAVLANLSAGQREVLLMRVVDGLSLDEIAQALAIPVGTVKSRLHNALESLRADPRAQRYFEA